MKKRLITLSAIALSIFLAYNVNAADVTYTQGTGDTANIITIPTTDVAEVGDVTFQASAQVQMSGMSSPTAFAHAAYHSQVLAKTKGREFGMGSDSASVFWRDISADGATATTVAATSSDDVFTGDNWNKM